MPILFKGGLNSRFFFLYIVLFSKENVKRLCLSGIQPKVKIEEQRFLTIALTRLKIPSEIKPPSKRMSTKFVLTDEFLDSTKNAMEPCLSIWYFLQIHEFTKSQMVSRVPNPKFQILPTFQQSNCLFVVLRFLKVIRQIFIGYFKNWELVKSCGDQVLIL